MKPTSYKPEPSLSLDFRYVFLLKCVLVISSSAEPGGKNREQLAPGGPQSYLLTVEVMKLLPCSSAFMGNQKRMREWTKALMQ